MSGYLTGLNRTGNEFVDAIIDEIEDAGNSYHHTEYWGDSIDWREDKRSYIERINDAIDIASKNLAHNPKP